MNSLKIALLSILTVSILFAQTPEQKGLELAKEIDKRDNGFGDTQVTLTMKLKNQHGQESTRYMRNKTLEQTNDGDKSLIIFDQPADVKGTATLTHSHKTESDDQWLYLPAIKRVKRISSNNKSGPFMGSEFAYEDLSSQEVEKFTYKYLRNETVNGEETFVMERYPVDPKSGYTKQVSWYNATHYRPVKIEFYDRKGALLKTLNYTNYKHYLAKFWRALQMEMTNHQTGKNTTLTFSDYQFGNGFNESDFNNNSLKRAR